MRRLALLAGLAATPAAAQPGSIALETTIVRFASEAGEHVGGYVRIRNSGDKPDQLIGLSCTCAHQIEIHSTARPGEMNTLAELDIPPGGTVEIRPGSTMHLMLEAAAPIPQGSEVEITFRFEHAGELTARFAVVGDTRAAWPPEHLH